MREGDLTTLKNVKSWLVTQNYTSPDSNAQTDIDATLSRLISRWSGAILAELERPWILPKSYSDQYDGNGGPLQFMRNWPVLSVERVVVGSQAIQAIPPAPTGPTQGSTSGPTFGYRYETWDGVPPGGPQHIDLVGSRFWRGNLNIQIDYTAGYRVDDELHTIPEASGVSTTSQVEVDGPQGIWGSDVKVTYNDADKTPLTKVTTAPTTAGQYRIIVADRGQPLTGSGGYEFFTGPGGDQGVEVLISYGFIPFALEQVCIECTCERWLYRGHIGEVSRSMNQQVTTRYMDDEWPKYVKPVLDRFRSILPL